MSPVEPRAITWRVDEDEAGRRLDVVVVGRVEDVSRAQVRRWIDDGRVAVDGSAARASRACREGEAIQVDVPAPIPAEPEPEALPLDVLFEDEHIIVVNKAAGMIVHPGPGHPRGTLVNALLSHCRDLSGIGGVERPGIVHRLDGGTTGVLVVAKHDRAHRQLAQDFQDRRVDKRYLAVVHGVAPAELVVDLAIGRDPIHRTRISSRGTRTREARTELALVEAFEGASLVAIRLHTGRTHQIRVHMSESGFPLIGDRDYGAPRKGVPGFLRDFPRPALHAERLSLTHPVTGESLSWRAEIPEDLAKLMAWLREHHAQARQ